METTSKELIVKSFKVFGITTATDGTKDQLVYCLKLHKFEHARVMLNDVSGL